MRVNNGKRGCWHRYDIMFVNNKWLAWYYPDHVTREEQTALVKEFSGGVL